MLAIDAWPPLGRDIVRAIYDIIGKKIEVLSEQVINRGITLVSQEPGDLDRLLMLSELNAAYAPWACWRLPLGVHPLPAYTELCRIVGQLVDLRPERRPPEIPAYDHDDLARIFSLGQEQIELLLAEHPRLRVRAAVLRRRGEGDAGHAGIASGSAPIGSGSWACCAAA